MKQIFTFIFTICMLVSTVTFAMESKFKDTDYNFKDMDAIIVHFIAYNRVLTDKHPNPNFVQHKIPEPIVLECLKNYPTKKKVIIGVNEDIKPQTYLVVEIYRMGSENEKSRGEMEFILTDIATRKVVYRHRFDREITGSCEDVIKLICKEFFREIVF